MMEPILINVIRLGSFLALLLVASVVVACGGGDSAPPGQEVIVVGGTPVPVSPTATPVFYVKEGDEMVLPTFTPVGGSASSLPRADGGSTTPVPPSVRRTGDASLPRSTLGPTSLPPAVFDPDHTPGPSQVTLTRAEVDSALAVVQRPCEDQFRQMLVDYDGVEEFGGEVVTRLSGEFVELRPDCLAQGWDPEFPADPLVCNESSDRPGSILHKTNDRSPTQYVSPTQRVERDQNFRELGRRTMVRINVHLNRVPLLGDVPERLGSAGSGLVGGCWTYKGIKDLSGFWNKSFIRYTAKTKRSGKVVARRVSGPILMRAPASFPECDSLFQSVLSKGLDSGEVYDSSGVGDAVDMSRALADGVCDLEIGPFRGWQPSPSDSHSSGCPARSYTGSQPDGSFVLNWAEEHYDGYAYSACWVRSVDGVWSSYPSPGGGG